MNKKTRLILFVALIIALLVGAIIVYVLVSRQADGPVEKTQSLAIDLNKKTAEIAQTDSQIGTEKLVDEFGQSYDMAYKNTVETPVSKWDESLINQAHLCLLYADKIGAYSEAQTMYYKIQFVKDAGKDVDANAARVTQAQRDEILERANTLQDAVRARGQQ